MNSQAKKDQKEKKAPKGEKPKSEMNYSRRKTGIRILASLFFGIVVWPIIETIVFVIIIFQLIHALIAERPNFWLIGFANHAVSYFYRVMRYLTFTEESAPFPFARFPAEIEKPQTK